MTSTIFNMPRVFALVLVLSVLIVPASVHAKGGEKSGRDDFKDRSSSSRSSSDDSSSSSSSKSKNKSGNFCSSLDSVSADIINSLPKCDQVLASTSAPFIPAPVDNRAEKLIALGERAKSPEKLKSVKEYKASVEVEFERHRKLVESEQFEFRTAADKALGSQRANFSHACRGYASTTKQALIVAKTSCLNGADESTVRDTLKKSLKNSQDTFVSGTAGVTVVQEKVKKLREARDSKVSASLDKLNKSTSSSLSKLKSVLIK